MIDIHKDASGKTYEYILTYKNEEILQGDGWISKEEIYRFFGNLQNAISESGYIPFDDFIDNIVGK